ncbi:MAG: DUF2127 domain-containing protein [Candidatus Zambryskibacteria bacterium]
MPPEIEKNNSVFEKILHQIFEFGIVVKGINGIWETISGFFILFLSKTAIDKLFYFLASKELLEDPRDLFFNFLFKFLENLSYNTQVFIAVYILLHGLLNIFLAIQLYRDKIWAYLVTITVMTVFIFYQIHRIILYHSPVLIAITIFDISFVVLTWYEYDRKKQRLAV